MFINYVRSGFGTPYMFQTILSNYNAAQQNLSELYSSLKGASN
jgi:hypothetical protein